MRCLPRRGGGAVVAERCAAGAMGEAAGAAEAGGGRGRSGEGSAVWKVPFDVVEDRAEATMAELPKHSSRAPRWLRQRTKSQSRS